jgi:dipeptidyl aminopeptidase/acylaminoacyl peptidase
MSRLRRRGSHGRVALVVALVAMTVAAGCGGPAPPSPPPTPPRSAASATGSAAASSVVGESPTIGPSTVPTPTESQGPASSGTLLLLAGRPGAMGLELVAADGRRRTVPLPDPDVAWISTDTSGRILATTRGGGAFLSEPITGLAGPTWRALGSGLPNAGPLPGPMSFGTLSPDGSRAAFVAADYGANRGFDVVIVDLATGTTSSIPIARPAEGAPPAWVGNRLVLLTRERGDAAGVTLLDPATGSLVDGPGPAEGSGSSPASDAWIGRIAGLTVSADGSTVAVGSAPGDRIEIGPAAPWLAQRPAELASVPLEPDVDGGRSFAWLALSPDGERLAVVRTDADGEAVDVTIHTADDGWRAGPPVRLPPGANRAVVAWLP